MNDRTDPVFKAMDRLARVADSSPVDDLMPGIMRRARANRRRAAALTAGGVAAVVAAGFGVVFAVELPDLARGPEVVSPSTTSPSPVPDTTQTPDASPTSPPDPPDAAVEYDRAESDVNGDGAADVIRVTLPASDAAAGMDSILESDDVRLGVELAAGGTVEIELDDVIVPRISGTQDLDGNGTAEVVLAYSAGDAGWLRVFTWDGDTMVRADPADDSPADLIGDGLFLIEGGVNSALTEIGLISWLAIEESAPYEVRLWTWQLDGSRLVATESEQTHCMSPDRYAEPGQFPEPC